MKHFITLFLPLAFVLLLINGLWNYAGGTPRFYFYISMAAPFLIVIFFGLFRILNAIAERFRSDT